MIRLFEEQVAFHGDKVAISDPVAGVSVTYRELEENAHRVAGKLRAEGLQKGDAVLIAASRSIGYITAILGVLMAGGVYVPLSDRYPAERIAYIRADSGAKFTIDDAFVAAAMQTEPVAVPEELAPEDIVLIIYTSGSTGNPKGILHDDRGLMGAVRRYQSLSGLNDGDVYGNNAPFYFIVHVTSVLGNLTAGVTSDSEMFANTTAARAGGKLTSKDWIISGGKLSAALFQEKGRQPAHGHDRQRAGVAHRSGGVYAAQRLWHDGNRGHGGGLPHGQVL